MPYLVGVAGGMVAAMQRLDRLLAGPYPRLPRPLDWCSEQWAALPPRGRILGVLAAVMLMTVAVHGHVSAAANRWGGTPRPALVATADLAVGAPVTGIREVELPPEAVPAGALQTVPRDARVALALPAGAVLTSSHVDPRGPAAGLPPGLRAVPIVVEEGWGVVAGAWVDVWVIGDGASSRLVASSRPVLDVRSDSAGITALIGLDADEVAATTAALGLTGVLLTHAPPPNPAR